MTDRRCSFRLAFPLAMVVGWLLSRGSTAGQEVVSFTLINAGTDQPVAGHDPIQDGATINTMAIGATNLNIRANSDPDTDFGSVRLELSGATTEGRTENLPVWALFGDSGGDFNNGSFNNGEHTLTGTPYTADNLGGTQGPSLTIGFTVTDMAGGPVDPVADAGPERSVILPDSQVTLHGSGSDGDGSIESYAWTRVSGPADAALDGEATADLTATGLVEGTYVFRLTVTDNDGRTGSDEVTVHVVPQGSGSATLTGECRKWHKLTFSWQGPNTSETANPNPFTDYRLDVTFHHPGSGKTHVIPGYYAADGEAAETSAASGKLWRCHFAPDETGAWTYAASFRTGPEVILDPGGDAGASAGFFDGDAGAFEIGPTDKTGRDFRGKGLLQYVGKHHLRFAETGEYFLKIGPDAPENFLAYDDFDGPFKTDGQRDDLVKSWSFHAGDWQPGDPGWQGTKGREMIGALNYLASEGLNVFSFLPMNIDGDDKNVFPYLDYNERLRLDCSRLDQWEIVFEHADKLGLYLHFKTLETENELLLDGGNMGIERTLYYRELIARFSHHLALNWNLGEEIDNATTAQKQGWATYFWNTDPYRHHLVIHNGANHYDMMGPYDESVGTGSELTGFSLQTNNAAFLNVFGQTRNYRDRSVAAGKPWVVACDEPGDASHALRPRYEYDSNKVAIPGTDDRGNSWIDGRKNALWGNVMAGGAGCEFYMGYQHGHSDLTCEDWRSRDGFWDYCRHLHEFFTDNAIPFWDMSNDDALSSNADSWCLRKTGDTYVVYLKNGGTTNLDLRAATGDFTVRWFDPRNGGALQNGSVTSVSGGGIRPLGNAPAAPASDWAILIAKAVPPNAYEDWSETHFAGLPGGADDPLAAFEADPFGTGLQNGVVYVFDGDPENPGAIRPLLPGFEIGGDLAFTMPEPPPTDVTVRLQASFDLAGWSDLAVRPAGGAWTGPLIIAVKGDGTATIRYSPGSSPWQFYRLALERFDVG